MTQTTALPEPEAMTVPLLREELAGRNVAIPSDAKKDELVRLLRAARAEDAAEASETAVEPVAQEDVEFVPSAVVGRSLAPVRAHEAIVARSEISVEELTAQADKIKAAMGAVMKPEIHYGKIPGVNKPTLLKPGAEVLCVLFRLSPHYVSEKIWSEDGHLTVTSTVTLTHIPTGLVVAEGEGLCSSRESKYAYRGEGRVCPICDQGTIKKSKFPPREGDYAGASEHDPPGWYCYQKVGGCGANFAANDPRIADQEQGKVANPDLPDTWNTVLKMANKRGLVAAVLNGTAASDLFTQDVEDARGGNTEQHVEARADLDWNMPANWTELMERLTYHLGADETPVWMQQAVAAVWNVDSLQALTQADRRLALQRFSGVLYDLDTLDGPELAFHPKHREVVTRAFARCFNGRALEGPEWRLSGDGEDRPLRSEAEPQPEPEPDPAAAEFGGGEADDIPFGS